MRLTNGESFVVNQSVHAKSSATMNAEHETPSLVIFAESDTLVDGVLSL